MVARQDARHGPATPRDRNPPREACSGVTAGKTWHSPPACGKQKRRQRTAEPSFRNGTHLSSVIASIVLSRRVSTNGLGPKDHARDSVSKVLIPDIELRRPAPHGTAFARVNGGDTCRHSRQL